MNVPNYVTFSRILLTPVVVLVYYSSLQWHYLAAAAIFTLASLTDWLDGYLARKLNQSSNFGAFIDPVADKLLVVVVLVLLASSYSSPWFVMPTAIIIAREILVSALREWMATYSRRDEVAVGVIGKVKTVSQMLAIILLLSADPSSLDWLQGLGYVLLYTAAFLALWSMINYLKNAWSVLTTD